MAKKHAPPTSKQSTVCSFCEKMFPSYYFLRQHQRKEQGVKQQKPSDIVLNLDNVVEQEGEDGEKLKEELSAFNNFWWIQKWKTKDIR